MNRTRGVRLLVVALVATGLTAACSLNPKEDPTRYYTLASLLDGPDLLQSAGLNAEGEDGLPALDLQIGVGPISFPRYLERSRMVTRLADSELQYLETERWAEPLDEAFQRVLAANLSKILRTDDVIFHPWYSTVHPDYSVAVHVVRFERDPQGTAHLAARWELWGASGDLIATEGFRDVEPPDSPSISGSVQAQDRLLARLSRRIADEIRHSSSD
ncbi:MAG: PqiC family protein [Candidatus Palauibacterales bacterium]|jgi:uncharacterized protein|nr:PqiC family protein [Candidatus Palauibacterales bacterium]MDP2481878.1 PqiC family protein [Candidatus Palauibacterales bacterium]